MKERQIIFIAPMVRAILRKGDPLWWCREQ